MPKICYQDRKFSTDSMSLIRQANAIITEYSAAGYDLTLRQVYYQFVARGLIRNKDSEYKRLGSVIADARLAGLIDWNAITDRTRHLRKNSHWDNPADIIQSAASSYAVDKWADQDYYVEVWIEKDALVGVIESVCQPLDVPHFSCRGYTSASEMWGASQRILARIRGNKKVVVLHLGDHDPSGVDMSRDIAERLEMFVAFDIADDWGYDTEGEQLAEVRCILHDDERLFVRRIALTWEQVEEYSPPPNPAKITDSRAAGYIAKYGNESWELDALDPAVLAGLVEESVLLYRDNAKWDAQVAVENRGRASLEKASAKWPKIEKMLNGKKN